MSVLVPNRSETPPWLAGSRQRLAPELGRVWRFACVGLLGVIVNSLLLWLLTERFHIFYVVSSALATEAAILSNFSLNHGWTFASNQRPGSFWPRLARFNLVALSGLTLTVSALYLFTRHFGLHYLVANLFAIGSGTAWNYLASRVWVWSRLPAE
jgi:dolichol-phosphate mannosyltransferase